MRPKNPLEHKALTSPRKRIIPAVKIKLIKEFSSNWVTVKGRANKEIIEAINPKTSWVL